MVVGLTIVAIIAALVVQFRNIIGPLILAFMLSYVLHPVAGYITQNTKIPWRSAVNLIYVLLIVLLAGFFTVTGIATVQQIQSLVDFIQGSVEQLPTLVDQLSTTVYQIGPFTLDIGQLVSQLNLQALTDQLLSNLQTVVGNVAGIVSSFAATTASTLGWVLFILLISYFLLADAGGLSTEIIRVEVPGYNRDIRRLGLELRKIWNAFLRGQLIIIGLVMVAYSLLMAILGVHYGVAIAVMAGLARFVPYVGPLVTGVVTFLVAFLQNGNIWGLQPLSYAIMVVVLSVILDQIFDNIVTPRFLGQTLGVHPAAVLVAAIIATNLIGIVGLILAAPVLATIQLIGRYILRKMFDLDPWPVELEAQEAMAVSWGRGTRRLRAWWRTFRR